MKRILTFLLIMQSLSFAKSGIEVKVGVNMSAVQEQSRFYNLYQDKNFSKDLDKSQLSSINNNEIAGEIETKVLKSIKVSPSVNVKVGGGLSIYLNNSRRLETGFKKKSKQPVEFPTLTNTNPLNEDTNFYEKIKEFVDDKFDETKYPGFKNINDNMPHMLKLAEKHTSASITAFGTIEVEKILRSDLSIYGGSDLGLDVSLSARSVEATSDDGTGKIKYLLERGTKVLPRVKGYFGVDYNNFEFEVGAGYPQLITVGVGYRFKF